MTQVDTNAPTQLASTLTPFYMAVRVKHGTRLFVIAVQYFDDIPGAVTLVGGKSYWLTGRLDRQGRAIYEERVH